MNIEEFIYTRGPSEAGLMITAQVLGPHASLEFMTRLYYDWKCVKSSHNPQHRKFCQSGIREPKRGDDLFQCCEDIQIPTRPDPMTGHAFGLPLLPVSKLSAFTGMSL
ncbi:hypothetical protein H2248_003270 [Termitomyces sp. 'cryptogamus']|nr:hypothetical protein H2248_003270 [Termitomyces sp. 'cryptogamus']